ncbi:MAG: tetratricopeptide repeat protein [Alphaproteobacteria bacterium]|nr:tetratricopeptide repeat protein [Alphaproteobacteria bacterium]
MRLASMTLACMLLAGTAGAVDTVARPGPELASARALVKEKRWHAAIGVLARLARLEPSADVFNLLAFSQRNAGDFASALENYMRALALDPDHLGAHEYLGELYVKTGEMEKARALLARLVVLCPAGCEEREDLEKAIGEGK